MGSGPVRSASASGGGHERIAHACGHEAENPSLQVETHEVIDEAVDEVIVEVIVEIAIEVPDALRCGPQFLVDEQICGPDLLGGEAILRDLRRRAGARRSRS